VRIKVSGILRDENNEGEITEMFEVSYNENHNLRRTNLVLKLSEPKTNSIKRSFSYAAAKIGDSQSNKYKNNVTMRYCVVYHVNFCYLIYSYVLFKTRVGECFIRN
jgi:hypothetical protein